MYELDSSELWCLKNCIYNSLFYKGPNSQRYDFSSSHVWMWEVDQKKGWVLKNWYFLNVVLEKTLESPLYCKEIKPVNPKEIQSWIFIGRTDAEVETPMQRTDSLEKTLILGKIEGKRRRGLQKMRRLDSITDSMDMSLSKLQEMVKNKKYYHVVVCGVRKSQTRLSDWTRTWIMVSDNIP